MGKRVTSSEQEIALKFFFFFFAEKTGWTWKSLTEDEFLKRRQRQRSLQMQQTLEGSKTLVQTEKTCTNKNDFILFNQNVTDLNDKKMFERKIKAPSFG